MIPTIDTRQQLAGLYVHIPFCRQKCGYCDFFSVTDHKRVEPFIAALRQEADMILPGLSFDSLYIGGGTPSALAEKQLFEIIDIIMIIF